MSQTKELVNRYAAIAWGILFLWLGVLSAIPGDQTGLFMLGTGFIFLGLNLARRMSNIPANGFSLILGILALAAGGYALVRPLWNLPHVEIGILPLGLIVVGLYILIPNPKYKEAS
jgi:hypothetical protein